METLQGYEVLDAFDEGPRHAWARARSRADQRPVLVRLPSRGTMTRVERARARFGYDLAAGAAGGGVARPLALEPVREGLALVVEDFGATTLRRWIDDQRGAAPLVAVARVAAGIAGALARVHGLGVTHKGVSPRAVLINPETLEVRLTGFEAATRLAREDPGEIALDGLEGELPYMSPEQTGRMNRGLDHRTDLYSLGAVAYEMLTGEVPFHADSAMALVHAHIAVPPRAPHALRPDVPLALSDVTLKLLSKNAEDRYQSAAGAAADLAECARQLAESGAVAELVVGRHDRPITFQLPQRLYGREAERRALLAAFERASRGGVELVLVAGYSGVGKSTLVHEVQRPLVRDGGYLAEGKYDALASVPYGALIDAFKGALRQILGEREAQVERWRADLREALGANGQVIVDVIPEVELLLGPQPPVPAQGLTATQNRFNEVFAAFIGAFARAEHPFVLFLDDLQWVDAGTLAVLSHLLRSGSARHLLLIGAYRDNEVDDAHPLMTTLGEFGRVGARVSTLTLEALGPAAVDELVVDALAGDRRGADELARVIYAKTGGNPFFVGQFLTSLHARGLLTYDVAAGRWTWALDAVQAESVTENVAALVSGRLHTLPESARDALCIGACCEGTFDLATLAAALALPQARVADDLWQAVQLGLVVPLDEGYKYAADGAEGGAARYRFAHDRVHEAAYALVPEGERPALHLRIGRLWRDGAAGRYGVGVFEVVNQLDLGRALIDDPDERRRLARLNLEAATRARNATAYASAARWLDVGCELLAAGDLAADSLARELVRARAECDYLLSRFEEADAGFTRVLEATPLRADKAMVYSQRFALGESRGRYDEVFDGGRQALRLFGVEIPPDAELPAAFGAELGALLGNMAGKAPGDLALLPEVTDPDDRARIYLMGELIQFGSYVNPMMFMLLAARMVNLSIARGHAPGSAIGYIGYALVLSGALGQYEAAYAFSRLALALTDRFDTGSSRIACRFIAAAFPAPWVRPLSESFGPLDEVYLQATESGALAYVGLAGMQSVVLRFFHGDELHALGQRARTQTLHQSRLHHNDLSFLIAGYWRAVHALSGAAPSEAPRWHDDAEIRRGISIPSWIAAHNIAQLTAAYLLGRLDEAAALGEATLPMVQAIFGFVAEAELRFYDALTRLARGAPAGEAAGPWRAVVDEHLAKLTAWAALCPANLAQRELLVRAELARHEGRLDDAAELYDKAIEAAAAADGRVHDHALAHELAGAHHAARGRRGVAWAYLSRARRLYAQWGADRKVAALDQRWPGLQEGGAAGGATLAGLDLAAALRASQALSGEIVLARLLRTLMTTMIETAGAQRGHLILTGDPPSVVGLDVGAGEVEPTVTPGGYGDRGDLAADVVRYVERTRARVVLGDASKAGQFRADRYVASARPRSVLCAPVLRGRELAAIIYLENNLVADAFTAERCELLDVLASQAAISLENARLYDTLDARVRERTAALHASNEELSRAVRQLRTMQRQLVVQEKLASLGALTAGIAHEIKNPLNFVNNFAEGVVGLVEDLEAEVDPLRARLGPAAAPVGALLEELRQTARRIAEHGRRADRIVAGMLDHARTGAGGERVKTELARLVAEHRTLAWQSFKNQHPGVSIALEGDLPPMRPVAVVPQDVGRVVVNLVNNACYSVAARLRAPPPGYRATVRVTARDLGDRVEVRVWDNGLGVDPAIREKVFHPFFTTKPAGEGTGLGLSISHDIVTLGHNGALTVESEPGAWAEFVMTLPRQPSSSANAAAEP